MATRRFLLASLAFAAALSARADVMPRDAHLGETIVQTVCSNQGIRSAHSIVSEGTLVMRTDMSDAFGFAGHCTRSWVLHAGVPAGTYEVVQEGFGFTNFRRSDGTLTVRPTGLASPTHRSLSGNWFDPAGPGRGFNIVQGASGALMVVWLDHAFEAPGVVNFGEPADPNWLVITAGSWIAPDTFRGILYRPLGTPAALPWDPSAARMEPVGLGTLTFSSDRDATFRADFLDTASTRTSAGYTARVKRFAF